MLVSNAGITADMLVLRMSEDDFTGVLDANLTGAFRVAKRAVPKMMRARWGRIVFVVARSSAPPARPARPTTPPPRPAWSAWPGRWPASSPPRSITVNVVAPGPIATDMIDAARDDARAALIEAAVPLGRIGEPDEVAAAVALPRVATPPAYITGAVLPVDGGLGMGATEGRRRRPRSRSTRRTPGHAPSSVTPPHTRSTRE